MLKMAARAVMRKLIYQFHLKHFPCRISPRLKYLAECYYTFDRRFYALMNKERPYRHDAASACKIHKQYRRRHASTQSHHNRGLSILRRRFTIIGLPLMPLMHFIARRAENLIIIHTMLASLS